MPKLCGISPERKVFEEPALLESKENILSRAPAAPCTAELHPACVLLALLTALVNLQG